VLLAVSLLIPEQRLEVPSAVEDAFDKDGLGCDHERDADPPLESRHAQSGQQIIALSPAQGECRQPVAERDDPPDIAVGTVFTRMRRDVLMQAVDVALSQGREDDPHRLLLCFPGATRLDATEDSIRGDAL
jgi:hypothetical protein